MQNAKWLLVAVGTGVAILQVASCSTAQQAGETVDRAEDQASASGAKSVAVDADVPTSGVFRGLVVFFRFAGDTADQGCTPRARQWSDPDELPDVAAYVLSDTPQPPFVDSSLTQYFYQQSNGAFTLYGEVYPRVLVTDSVEAHYNLKGSAGSRATLDALSEITTDLLDQIDEFGFDFGRFDSNGDGYVDHIFMVPRTMSAPVWSGFSVLGNEVIQELEYDGVRIDWGSPGGRSSSSGSYSRYNWKGNIFPQLDLVRLMAHEFGHQLFRPHLVHLGAIGGRTGVPDSSPSTIGYVLMAGQGGGKDARGDATISALERDLLDDDWIRCERLSEDGTYLVGDLYSSDAGSTNCYTFAVSVRGEMRTIYLSNRQRIGFFDKQKIDVGCTDDEEGLKTTGLLVQARDERNRVAVVSADGTLKLSIYSSTYAGDLFGDRVSQLTPWTRPNASAFTRYPAGFTMSVANWQALDNITRNGLDMEFDYRSDFRINPVIRDSSWMGAETVSETLSGVVRVDSGGVLTLEDEVTLPDVYIESGGTLIVASSADAQIAGKLDVDVGGEVIVQLDGTLTEL
ncbi:MAG TPA: hypothetical protein VMO47_01345 [Rhodothermales bacterium]|nr:hypothetical protein [Rhodothermales bacterium]